MSGGPQTLYGVVNWNKRHALYDPKQWARLRAGDGAWGFVNGDQNGVIYFHDVGARDDFIKVFGGQSATLNKKATKVHIGEDAMKLARRINA